VHHCDDVTTDTSSLAPLPPFIQKRRAQDKKRKKSGCELTHCSLFYRAADRNEKKEKERKEEREARRLHRCCARGEKEGERIMARGVTRDMTNTRKNIS
jgi:hypothetical protein